jgi:hypothetical protein
MHEVFQTTSQDMPWLDAEDRLEAGTRVRYHPVGIMQAKHMAPQNLLETSDMLLKGKNWLRATPRGITEKSKAMSKENHKYPQFTLRQQSLVVVK